jgi:hypothetical protein
MNGLSQQWWMQAGRGSLPDDRTAAAQQDRRELASKRLARRGGARCKNRSTGKTFIPRRDFQFSTLFWYKRVLARVRAEYFFLFLSYGTHGGRH